MTSERVTSLSRDGSTSGSPRQSQGEGRAASRPPLTLDAALLSSSALTPWPLLVFQQLHAELGDFEHHLARKQSSSPSPVQRRESTLLPTCRKHYVRTWATCSSWTLLGCTWGPEVGEAPPSAGEMPRKG